MKFAFLIDNYSLSERKKTPICFVKWNSWVQGPPKERENGQATTYARCKLETDQGNYPIFWRFIMVMRLEMSSVSAVMN